MNFSKAELRRLERSGKATTRRPRKRKEEKPLTDLSPPPAPTPVNVLVKPDIVTLHAIREAIEKFAELAGAELAKPARSDPMSYEFTIQRDRNGFINRVVATPTVTKL